MMPTHTPPAVIIGPASGHTHKLCKSDFKYLQQLCTPSFCLPPHTLKFLKLGSKNECTEVIKKNCIFLQNQTVSCLDVWHTHSLDNISDSYQEFFLKKVQNWQILMILVAIPYCHSPILKVLRLTTTTPSAISSIK